MKRTENKVLSSVMALIPHEMREEILGMGEPEEIRLRAYGISAIVLGGRNIALSSRVNQDAMREILKKACDMAIYAHRDDICRGYVSMSGGVRIGVVGHARYEGGRLGGIGDVSSLVFRIPSSRCSFGEALYSGFMKKRAGMLICSRAGCGKTTAIRYLAHRLGTGDAPMRVVVVDERCEFDTLYYKDAMVDILRGYKRALGVDIAIRTMSAEILIVDEIGTDEDADALLGAIGAGVTVIATAHGNNVSDVLGRGYVKRLCDAGLFDTYAVIRRKNGTFTLDITEKCGEEDKLCIF